MKRCPWCDRLDNMPDFKTSDKLLLTVLHIIDDHPDELRRWAREYAVGPTLDLPRLHDGP